MNHAGMDMFLTWLFSVFQSYIVCILIDLAFKFNPWSGALRLRKLVGDRVLQMAGAVKIGQWQREREIAMSTERNYMNSLIRDEIGSPIPPASGSCSGFQRHFLKEVDVETGSGVELREQIENSDISSPLQQSPPANSKRSVSLTVDGTGT